MEQLLYEMEVYDVIYSLIRAKLYDKVSMFARTIGYDEDVHDGNVNLYCYGLSKRMNGIRCRLEWLLNDIRRGKSDIDPAILEEIKLKLFSLGKSDKSSAFFYKEFSK